MTKMQKRWVSSPGPPPKPKVPESVRTSTEERATEFVKAVLKPKHIKPPPESPRFNYIVDIYTKWYRHYFYFCAKYACPGPNAISPSFEAKFARFEYVGDAGYNLSFMRHTGEWIEIYRGLSLEEGLSAIEDNPWFQP